MISCFFFKCYIELWLVSKQLRTLSLQRRSRQQPQRLALQLKVVFIKDNNMLLVKHGWMVVTIDARALVPVLRNAHNRKANWHVILTSYSKQHAVNVKDHVLKNLIYMSKLLSFFYGRCAQYSNLPSNCREETIPGECCKQITCAVSK